MRQEVSLVELLVHGQIGGIFIGTSADEVVSRWGPAANVSSDRRRPNIWKYGTVQLHFWNGRVVYAKVHLWLRGHFAARIQEGEWQFPLSVGSVTNQLSAVGIKTEPDLAMIRYGVNSITGPSGARWVLGEDESFVELGSLTGLG